VKKLETEEKTLALCQQLDKLMDFMNMREKKFNYELLKLESESLDLKLRLQCLKIFTKPNLTSFRTGAGTSPQKHLTG